MNTTDALKGLVGAARALLREAVEPDGDADMAWADRVEAFLDPNPKT